MRSLLLPKLLLMAPMPNKESAKRPPLPVSIQLSSPKHRLRLKLKQKPKLLLVVKHKLLPLPRPPLLPMPLPLPAHSTSLRTSSRVVSPSMYWSRDQELNARVDRLPRFNIPVPSLLMVKYSIPPFQEVNQLHSLLVK